MIKLPFTFLPPQAVFRLSRPFMSAAKRIMPMFPFLEMDLRQLGYKETAERYLAMCLFSTISFSVFMGVLFGIVLAAAKMENGFVAGIIIALIFALFVFFQQVLYPKMLIRKRIRAIEKNLMPALQNILIQLNSGVPAFNILVNISSGKYGDLSKEFGKAVREINAGKSQVDALEEMATNNPSMLFRRAIWQLVNGMKAGGDISAVMAEIINALNEQQMIQIQNYGAQLSPLAMFYMLMAVKVPSLSVTFIIVIASFIAMSPFVVKLLFWGLLAVVVFMQMMFLGVIKSRRPNLLAE